MYKMHNNMILNKINSMGGEIPRKVAGVIPAGKAIRDGSQPRSIGSVGCMITRCHVQIEQKRLGACIG